MKSSPTIYFRSFFFVAVLVALSACGSPDESNPRAILSPAPSSTISSDTNSKETAETETDQEEVDQEEVDQNPPEDQFIPKRGLLGFGGMYGGGSENYINPATGEKSCPKDYIATKILGTAGVDYPLHFCFKVLEEGEEAIYDFGGIYGRRPNNFYANPLTQSDSCPIGFDAQRVLGHPNVDWNLTFCYREQSPDEDSLISFGGFFGSGNNGGYSNPITSQMTCPENHSVHQVYGTEGTDYPLHVCLGEL